MNYSLKFEMCQDLFDITYLLRRTGVDMSMVSSINVSYPLA